MTEQLCASCKSGPEKKCFFKEIVDNIVNSVPPKKQQTPICKGSKATLEAEKAHAEIAHYRTVAREVLNCPNVNRINPSYPGRNGL